MSRGCETCEARSEKALADGQHGCVDKHLHWCPISFVLRPPSSPLATMMIEEVREDSILMMYAALADMVNISLSNINL